MEIEILDVKNKSIGRCKVAPSTSIDELKKHVHKLKSKLHPDRQSLRLEVRGKTLKDSDKLDALNVRDGGKIYCKDLGPQIGWKTVFLAEYAGPLLVYLMFYNRPSLVYGETGKMISNTTHIAAACWTIHYAKRLLETIFVHRFSHSTMPIRNLFKNCLYYWGFTAFVAYHVNHPLYTAPSDLHTKIWASAFVLAELGNFFVHIALRNLRPPGTKVRRIPVADGNPLTGMFNFVSCPNYTYEFLAWLSFSIMTQCVPAYLFAAAGMYQMTVWALGKHRNYRKEFSDYPKSRKAILPFLI